MLADLEIRGTGTGGEEKIRSEAALICSWAARRTARSGNRRMCS
jgi:hypothetical protein